MSKKQPVMSHDPLADLAAPNESAPVQDEVADGGDVSSDGAQSSDASTMNVTLPVSMTIADVGELHAGLRDGLSGDEPVQLNGGEVEIIDGAGMQFLAALFKAAGEKQLTIDWSATSDVLVRAAEQIGLTAELKLQGAQQTGQPG